MVAVGAYQPLLSTGEIAGLLATITVYGVLSMANFAILGYAVSRQSREAYQACRALAGVNYAAGLAAYPIVGFLIGLPSAGEIAALMYLELAILALVVSYRAPRPAPTPGLPRARARFRSGDVAPG
jgi:hypothetical protein